MRLQYIFLIMLLSVTIVSAVDVGDVLTQKQVNSINFDTINLNVQPLALTLDTLKINLFFTFYGLKDNSDGTFEIIRMKSRVYFPIVDFVSCVSTNGRATCVSGLRTYFQNTARTKVSQYREKLKSFQNNEIVTLEELNLDLNS